MESSALHAGRHPVDQIAEHVPKVLRAGLRPAKLVTCVALADVLGGPTADVYEAGAWLADELTLAIETLGHGPVGHACLTLFGGTDDSRGRLLKDRRRMAADELDLMPSTFRKYYENDLLADVAFALWERAYHTGNNAGS